MLRFVTVPKTPNANILFSEFTDNDALLEALRFSLANSRITIQAHNNRRTAAFISFYDNWNVAIWPRKIFEPDEIQALGRMFSDMRQMLGYHLLRTIIGENEEVTLAALLGCGWQQDGYFRKLTRNQDGSYIDGLIMSFEEPPAMTEELPTLPEEDHHEFSHRRQFEEQNDAGPLPAEPSAVRDPGAVPASVDDESSAEPGVIWPV